jgi:enoyl-CoA hydratase
MPAESEIRFQSRGCVGLVTLDRGHALNALTHNMVLELSAALDRWERDPEIAHLVIRSGDAKAFSAGGDIRDLYESGLKAKRGEGAKPITFFEDEYRLNIRIKTFPKPYIALIDGIVMGGGVGVSINGSHRVAGPNIRFAMPEVGIGFFPDVGATWFLPRLPGETGTYLALTGARMAQADCCWSGIATQAGDPERFDELVDALAASSDTEAVLAEFSVEPEGAATLLPYQDEIGGIFGGENLLAIEDRLNAAAQGPWPEAEKAAKTFGRMSPTSLAIALRQMRLGIGCGFADCMKTEFRIVSRVLDGDDFYEGIRAQIIDKDRLPVWKPARLADIDMEEIDRYFAPLDEGTELVTIANR